jgi:hypothetical protein
VELFIFYPGAPVLLRLFLLYQSENPENKPSVDSQDKNPHQPMGEQTIAAHHHKHRGAGNKRPHEDFVRFMGFNKIFADCLVGHDTTSSPVSPVRILIASSIS